MVHYINIIILLQAMNKNLNHSTRYIFPDQEQYRETSLTWLGWFEWIKGHAELDS